MRAVVLKAAQPVEFRPLKEVDRELPEPGPAEIRVRIEACALCRTDLHIVEGELPARQLPIIPGHQAVGVVEARGSNAQRFSIGDRAGIAWLRHTCGHCSFCATGHENLCREAMFTGFHADGGFAEAAVVDERYAYRMPIDIDPASAAPLLCGGVIGFRAVAQARVHAGACVALYGFGSSAHLVLQLLLHLDCTTFVMTRHEHHRALARQLGAAWAGNMTDRPPQSVDSAIVFAPVGDSVRTALSHVRPGGTVAVAGVYLGAIPELNYQQHLAGEKTLCSVTANTRADGDELLRLGSAIPLRTRITTFPLSSANDALLKLKRAELDGSGVLLPR